jgi:hypothetical protein
VPVPLPVPSLPVPALPVPAGPAQPDLDLDLDADVDIDLDLGPLPTVPVGGPVVAPPVPPQPTDPSLIGIAARVRCGIGLDADLDLVLAGRPTASSHVVVTHPDSLLTVDLDLGAGATRVVPLVDVVLGHRVLDLVVDGVAVEVAVDLSCPIDLPAILTPTCVATLGGLQVHLASRLDAALALLLGVQVLDPVTGAVATASLDAGATVDLWLAGSEATLLEVHAQLLGIDLAVGVLTCPAPSVTPTTTPTTAPPTTAPPVTAPNDPTATTVPTTTPATPGPTTTTPGPEDPTSPQGSAGPLSATAPAPHAVQASAVPASSTGSLPITGSSSLVLIAAAAALVASGMVLLRIARRRTPGVEP